jgi:hypothetical protein
MNRTGANLWPEQAALNNGDMHEELQLIPNDLSPGNEKK